MLQTNLVFGLSRESYAVPVENVLGLTKYDADAVHRPFGIEGSVRGLILHQGTVIPVFDLRSELGMQPMEAETAEFIEILDGRKRDHINWLNELEASVRENRAFHLSSNHHECEFGKWYDRLLAHPEELSRFTNGNSTLQAILRPFDEPHQRIHKLAVHVGHLREQGHNDEAMLQIERTRHGDLDAMITLFDRTKELVTSLRRTLMLVLEHEGDKLGVLIDQVHCLKSLGAEHMQSIPLEGDLIRCMALPDASENPIAMVDVAALYRAASAGGGEQASPAETAAAA